MTTTTSIPLPAAASPRQPVRRRSDEHRKSDAPIRQMDFGFAKRRMKAHFFSDNPLLSMYFLSLSLVVPYGEQLVINTVRIHRDQIQDPDLRARVTGLIGQEAWHTHAHRDHNRAFAALGYPMEEVEAVAKVIFKMLDSLPNPAKLSLMAAVEHLTGVLSEYFMAHPEQSAEMDPCVRDIWLWHMLEEGEHKSIAYDVFQTFSGNYLLRTVGLLPATVAVLPILLVFTTVFMASDRSLWRPSLLRKHASGLMRLIGPKGMFGSMLPSLLEYFDRDYHPDNRDTSELIAHYREQLLGQGGVLAPSLKKVVHPKAR